MLELLCVHAARIHSCNFKLARVHVVHKPIESHLCLCARVKHNLVQKGMLGPPKAILVAWGHFSRLIVDLFDHLMEKF